MWWDLFIDIWEHVVNAWLWKVVGSLKTLSDAITGLLSQASILIGCDNIFSQQILFKSGDGVAELLQKVGPLFHLLFVSVGGWEITSGVITHSIRYSFNKNGSLISDNHLSSLLCGGEDGKNIITVDPDGWHAISYSSDGNSVSCVLIIDWSGNSVHVVSAIEQSLAS